MTWALVGVLGYLILGILSALSPRPQHLSAIALALGTVAFALWLPGFSPRSLGLGPWAIVWEGDTLAASFWGLALFLHLVLLLDRGEKPRRFYPLLTLILGTSLSLVLSQDLFNLYVSLELTSLIAFLLVGLWGKPGQIWASLKYLILTSCGMIVYLLGTGLIYGETGTLSLISLGAHPPSPGDPAFRAGVALLLAGAAAKGGVFFYSQWLPTAYGYAPPPVGALLSGFVGKMGIVVMARLAASIPVGDALIALGIGTGLLGIVHALWEEDLGAFLGYITMAQVGYMLLGLGWGRWDGAIAYGVAHGLANGILFLAAGRAVAERGRRPLAGDVAPLPPLTRGALALGVLSLSGVPPLPGYIARALLSVGLPPWSKGVLFALSLGTAAALARLWPLILRGGKVKGGASRAVIALGIAIAGVGLWGQISLPAAWDGVAALIGAGVPLMGVGLYRFLKGFRLPLPKWRLEEAALAFLVATALLSLWF